MKPDYSIIEPMACKCVSIEERDEILRQLKEWGVPMSAVLKGILLGELDDGLWLYIDEKQTNYMVFIGDSLEEDLPENAIDYQVFPSYFLSAFREVYEASNRSLLTNSSGIRNYKGPLPNAAITPVTDKGIVFPSDEELYKIAADVFDGTTFECIEKTGLFDRFIDKTKEEIIRLNPHLKV